MIRLTVAGDERLNIDTPPSIDIRYGSKWVEVEEKAKKKVSLKNKWQADYEVYEWHLTDANGELLNSNNTFTQNTTVYAVTNYNKFKREGSKLTGYTGDRPQGKIIIPDGITEIGSAALAGCPEITHLKFPQSLRKISMSAFGGCSKITDLALPSGLETIETFAFGNCPKIKNMELPAGLINVRGGAFAGCNFTSFTVHPENKTFIIENNIIYNKDKTELYCALSNITSVTFPSNLTKIRDNAFMFCSELTSLNLPGTLNTIGISAFSYCSKLTDVELPKSLTNLGVTAFGFCTKLTNLTVQSGNAVYESDNNLIYKKGKKELVCAAAGSTSVIVPDSVTVIESQAFGHCTELTTITLSANLREIRRGAFVSCKKLTQVQLPAQIKKIDRNAFAYCDGLTNVTFEDKTGWAVYNDSDYKYKYGNISFSDLEDAGKAAQYLKNDYKDKFWKKN